MLFISFFRDQSNGRLPHVINPLGQTCLWALAILLIKFFKPLGEKMSDALAEDPLWYIAFLGQPNSCLHSI